MRKAKFLHAVAIAGGLLLPTAAGAQTTSPPVGIICDSIANGGVHVEDAFWTAINTYSSGKECEAAIMANGAGWIEHVFTTNPRSMRFQFRLTRVDFDLPVPDAFQLFRLEADDGTRLVKVRLKRTGTGDHKIDVNWVSENNQGNATLAWIVGEVEQTLAIEWIRSSKRAVNDYASDGAIRVFGGSYGQSEQLLYEQTSLLIQEPPHLVQFGAIQGIDLSTGGMLEFSPLEVAFGF